MRLRGDVDQEVLGQLYYQYLNVEEEFVKALFTDGQTQLGRVFVQERVLPTNGGPDGALDPGIQVLDYEGPRLDAMVAELTSTAERMGFGKVFLKAEGRDRETFEDSGMEAEATMTRPSENSAATAASSTKSRRGQLAPRRTGISGSSSARLMRRTPAPPA